MPWNPSKNRWERDKSVNRKHKWIGVTAEVRSDVNIPMGGMWGYSRVIRDVGNAPNSTLEKYSKEKRLAFGRVVNTDPQIREALRSELMRRCREGIYLFESRAEKVRLQPVARMHDGNPKPNFERKVA